MDSVLLSKQCRLISPGHFATAVLGLLAALAITGCGEAPPAAYRPTATLEATPQLAGQGHSAADTHRDP